MANPLPRLLQPRSQRRSRPVSAVPLAAFIAEKKAVLALMTCVCFNAILILSTLVHTTG